MNVYTKLDIMFSVISNDEFFLDFNYFVMYLTDGRGSEVHIFLFIVCPCKVSLKSKSTFGALEIRHIHLYHVLKYQKAAPQVGSLTSQDLHQLRSCPFSGRSCLYSCQHRVRNGRIFICLLLYSTRIIFTSPTSQCSRFHLVTL